MPRSVPPRDQPNMQAQRDAASHALRGPASRGVSTLTQQSLRALVDSPDLLYSQKQLPAEIEIEAHKKGVLAKLVADLGPLQQLRLATIVPQTRHAVVARRPPRLGRLTSPGSIRQVFARAPECALSLSRTQAAVMSELALAAGHGETPASLGLIEIQKQTATHLAQWWPIAQNTQAVRKILALRMEPKLIAMELSRNADLRLILEETLVPRMSPKVDAVRRFKSIEAGAQKTKSIADYFKTDLMVMGRQGGKLDAATEQNMRRAVAFFFDINRAQNIHGQKIHLESEFHKNIDYLWMNDLQDNLSKIPIGEDIAASVDRINAKLAQGDPASLPAFYRRRCKIVDLCIRIFLSRTDEQTMALCDDILSIEKPHIDRLSKAIDTLNSIGRSAQSLTSAQQNFDDVSSFTKKLSHHKCWEDMFQFEISTAKARRKVVDLHDGLSSDLQNKTLAYHAAKHSYLETRSYAIG